MKKLSKQIGTEVNFRFLKYTVSSIIILFLIFGLVSLAASAKVESYKFGAFPMVSAAQVERVFSPVAAEFSRVLNKKVFMRTKPTFKQYRIELSRQTYDFAIVQPFDYVIAHDKYGYLPMARFHKPLFGSFMVSKDSEINSLKDLKGKTIAFPPIKAAVTHMGKKMLTDFAYKLDQDVKVKYMKSHDSCLRLVIVKKAAACVSSLRAVHIFESKWGKSFRVLKNTPHIPNSLFIVHKRVPKKVRELLIKTMASWPTNSEVGKQFIKNSNNMHLVPANNKEYDIVRNFPRVE